MHIVRNSAPLLLPYGQQLPPGEWLMQDDTAFMCAVGAERGAVSMEAWRSPLRGKRTATVMIDEAMDVPEPRSILLIRSGAIGDLLLLSPCLKPLREKYPNASITLCCYGNHFPVIQSFFKDFDVAHCYYPIGVFALANYDLIIPLENIIELATEKGIHATDAFAEALGVTVTDYKPVYRVTPDEAAHVDGTLGFGRAFNQKPRVALHLHASSKVRGYPLQNWNFIMQQLLNRGWEIMLLGSQDGIKGAPPAIKDCSGLSFREAAAVLATCDVFCGVDSSFFNLCPALGVPAIGLFGPVDWRTRVKEGSGQLALAGVGECAPCGWTNSRAGRQWPAGMPCEKAGTCVPLAEIKPERVVAKIDQYRK